MYLEVGVCLNMKQYNKNPHPDYTKKIVRLRKVKGQIEGIEKMILDRRY